jgi:hypothetical protein
MRAMNSSYIDKYLCVELSGLLMKVMGLSPCMSTTLNPRFDASVSTTNGLSKLGRAKIGVDNIAALSLSNATCASSDQENCFFFNRFVSALQSPIVFDKLPIIHCKPQEPPELIGCHRHRPVLHSLSFLRVCGHPSTRYNMT